MRLWVIRPNGAAEHFVDPWRPLFYVAGEDARAEAMIKARRCPADFRRVERGEVFSGKTLSVLEVRLPQLHHGPLVQALRDAGVPLYNADVHPVQAYHYDRGHFPLARCRFEIEDSRVLGHELLDDPWALDYELPPLKYVHLSLSGSELAGPLNPNHAVRGGLVLQYEGRAYELEGPMEEQLLTLKNRLVQWDPDVLTTDWGDSHLLPSLDALCRKYRRSIPFSRDPGRAMEGRGDRSFQSYGQTVYQSGSRYLFGRWHLDLKNSFYFKECGLEGLYEIARTAKIPVQRAARTTIGTSLSSMQMDYAWREGLLIPMDKQQVEDFRPATDLIVADKGGLVYEPEIGWYDNVAEYDFVSMYPTVMVRHNISPETVNCPCCPENKVPEIGHHLCKKRRGIVPNVLTPILIKRARYKELSKTDHPMKDVYKKRAAVFKWCLVTCFGYLGFKNARFGKIEAHECVNAWGREVLLQAKEVVEGLGYHILHGFVDCLWVQGHPGMDYEGVRKAVEERTGCPVGLEGVYKWLRFCPSKTDPLSGIPNRYFGAFTDGTTKVRGLALRRRDTPELLKRMQLDLIRRMAQMPDVAACRSLQKELEEIVEEYRYRLKEGRVTARDLAVTFRLSKNPEEYVHDTLSTIAAKRLRAGGVDLHPGETLQYVIVSSGDKIKELRSIPLALIDEALEYDAAKYLELMGRAEKEILDGLWKRPGGVIGTALSPGKAGKDGGAAVPLDLFSSY